MTWVAAVGEPWTNSHIPKGSSFGWYVPNFFVIADDAFAQVELESLRSGPLRIGVADFHGTPWIAIQSTAFELFDAPSLYVTGSTPPDISSADPRLLCALYVVERGVTVALRMFTLSTACTTLLRRLFAEQRAHGPILIDQGDVVMEQWYSVVQRGSFCC